MKVKSLVAALLAVAPASAYAQGTPGGSERADILLTSGM
jgi:hypothetical protein